MSALLRFRQPGHAAERAEEKIPGREMPFVERMERIQAALDAYGAALGAPRYADRRWLTKCDQLAGDLRLLIYPVLDIIPPEQDVEWLWPDALRNFGLLLAAIDLSIDGVRAHDVVLLTHASRLLQAVGRYSRSLSRRDPEKPPVADQGPRRPPAAESIAVADLIAELAVLHGNGVLQDEEFETKKAELLARI